MTVLPPLNLFNWLLALLPVILLITLMLWQHWGGSKAGAAAYLVTLLIAWLRFGAGFEVFAYAQAKAVLLSLDVLWIIWNALLLFHLTREAGAIDRIGKALSSLTPNRTMQGLILGWIFSSFVQGLGGFGVPIAITAPLLVGVGFSPVQAVIMAAMGHSWGVTFGSLASSFQTLLAVTGLPAAYLAPYSLLLLGIACYVCGMLVALLAGGWKGLRQTILPILAVATVMAGTQFLVANYVISTLGVTLAGILGLAAIVLITRLPRFRNPEKSSESIGSVIRSFSSYIILVVLAFGINLIPPLNDMLSRLEFTLQFPALQTSLGMLIPAGHGRVLQIFSHPGTILLYSSLISLLLYRKLGYYQPGYTKRITAQVTKGAIESSLGIMVMVALSVVMSDSGMTQLIAQGLSQSVSRVFYPLIDPFIGALGAFITGSNNNANVLFGVLQMKTAELLGLSVPLILAAQTAGGSLGSVLAPAKVIVGCSTVGLGGQEGTVMKKMLLLGLIPIAVVAVAAFLIQLFI